MDYYRNLLLSVSTDMKSKNLCHIIQNQNIIFSIFWKFQKKRLLCAVF